MAPPSWTLTARLVSALPQLDHSWMKIKYTTSWGCTNQNGVTTTQLIIPWVLLVPDCGLSWWDCLQFLRNNLNILHLPPLSSGRPLMDPSLVVSLLSLVFFSRTGAGLEVQCRPVEDIKLNVSVISPDSVLLTWELTSLQDLQLEAVFSCVGRRWNIYFTNFSQTKLNKVVVVISSQKVSVESLLLGNV